MKRCFRMFEKDNSICKDTCIVINRCSQFLQNSGSKLELDSNPKNRGALSFLSTLEKTTWTCIVEGVTEYCRIIYDIFPPDFKIQVLCSDETVTDVNTFDDESQNIQQVLKGFGELGPPKRISEWSGAVSIYPGVAQAAENLLNKNKNGFGTKLMKRLIVITALEDDSDSNSISNVVWEIQNQLDKASVCHIDLIVVNITNKSDVVSSKREVSSHLMVTTMSLKNSHCTVKIAKLTRIHYNLHSTVITGIPMKEEQHAGTSANYDVEIIHSSLAHIDAFWSMDSSAGKDLSSRPPVTLKWCTPKANSMPDLQLCYGSYRVTPSEVNSRPAACLIMFLLQGRTVMLEAPKKSGAKVLTHMLQCHGGDVYIHVLPSGRSPLEDPPSISEGIGGRVTDYRVNDFGKFMKQNRLAPYTEDSDESHPNKKVINRLERYSKHWPMIISDTLIFNMQANLDPLLSYLLKPTLTDEEVQDCKKVIYKLQAMESRSDSLPLPIVTLKGKGTKKEEQYKQVWSELELFIEGASTTSFMHKKVLDCIRGTQETNQEVKSSDVEMKAEQNGTEKSWTELDRYQQMTEREKKAFNEAPSDPRRRRRISESAIKPAEQQQQQQRKSPSRQDEPPGKLRRTNSRVALSNVSSALQAKSSLLSIFCNHMNLTASRLHEEFLGRKQSVGGKYELYQTDPDQLSQTDPKHINNKAVSEWV